MSKYSTKVFTDDVDFLTYVDGKYYRLASDKNCHKDKLSETATRLYCGYQELEGALFVLTPSQNETYSVKYSSYEDNMKDCGVGVFEKGGKKYPCSTKENCSSLKLLEVEQNIYYVQETSTNLFLFLDQNEKRDENSFYVNFTDDKSKASQFKIQELDLSRVKIEAVY